jgi:hypothetical protein
MLGTTVETGEIGFTTVGMSGREGTWGRGEEGDKLDEDQSNWSSFSLQSCRLEQETDDFWHWERRREVVFIHL